MPSDREAGMTTIKVGPALWSFVEEHSKPDESMDAAVRRLLRIRGPKAKRPERRGDAMRTMKVSRDVMERIRDAAKPKESRDETLARLLGIHQGDGNVGGEQ